MSEVSIYILMDHIMPIPIAVSGFYPILISPEISTQDESTYVNLYRHVNISLAVHKCNRFNGMYYLCRRGNLTPWIGICPQDKYFCFQDENIKDTKDASGRRWGNFEEVISPIGAKEKLKSCDILCTDPIAMEKSVLYEVSESREKISSYFLLHKIICATVPSYEGAFIKFISFNNYFKNNMFVTSREIFLEYVNMTAIVMNRLKQEKSFHEEVVFSFDQVAEILMNVFIINKKFKVRTLPVMNVGFTESKFS